MTKRPQLPKAGSARKRANAPRGTSLSVPRGAHRGARSSGRSIVPRESDYLAFYIGFAEGFEKSTISMARSVDGIHDWERYPDNPIIKPGPPGSWEDCNVYKPYVVRYRDRWYLWYNGSRFSDRREQLGLATTPEIDF